MKTALIVILVINIISGVIVFLSLLATNPLIALLYLLLAALALVPTLALIRCLDDTEQMRYDILRLKERVQALEYELNGGKETLFPETYAAPPQQSSAISSPVRWQCAKCGSVNREHSSICENCGAHFSIDCKRLTDVPLTKWRLKDKKKKNK